MFSGKTEELLRGLKRARFANQQVLIFKPRLTSVIVIKGFLDANEIMSTPVEKAIDILSKVNEEDIVAIDEAQFFDDDIITVCNKLANNGIRVIVAGLDMDFKGKPFGPMPHLMAIAEFVTKVHAICTKTGNLAH